MGGTDSRFEGGDGRSRQDYWVLAAILAAAFLLRWFLIGQRWVNPDEGAHLMDARLVLDGLLPEVDYSSRQIAYVYVSAAVLWLVGVSFENARFFPVLCTLATGWIVFLVARRLFDRRVGWLAAAFFLLVPFGLFLSINYKTQPLSILVFTLAVYCTVRYVQDAGGAWLAASAGVLLAFGFYVRQSAIAVLAGLVLYFVLVYRADARRLARTLLATGAGCLAVVGLVFVVYARYLPLDQIFGSALDPVGFIIHNLGRAFSSDGAAPDAMAALPTPELALQDRPQAWTTTRRNIFEAAYLNVFLLVGAGLSIFTRRVVPPRSPAARPYLLLYCWLAGLAGAYAFYAAVRGFYQAYFLELLPPLAILAAAATIGSLSALRKARPRWRDVGIAALVVAALVPPLVLLANDMNRPLYLAIVTGGLAFAYLLQRGSFGRLGLTAVAALLVTLAVIAIAAALPAPLRLALYLLWMTAIFAGFFNAGRWWSLEYLGRQAGFVGYALILSSVGLGLSASVDELGLRYDGSWSPETVRAVTALLETRDPTAPATDDEAGEGGRSEALSGAMIWEFEAGLAPFANLTHPLALLHGSDIPPEIIAADLRARPPRFVILDGYAERTYLYAFPWLRQVLDDRYRSIGTFGGSRYPVEIFELWSAGGRSPP